MRKLARDATIADIVSHLDQPEDYVRGVLMSMTACNKKHRKAYVSIGTAGGGKFPHYRVGPMTHMDHLMNGGSTADYFTVFNGRNHDRMEDWGHDELKAGHWSVGQMTYREVLDLLNKITEGGPDILELIAKEKSRNAKGT